MASKVIFDPVTRIIEIIQAPSNGLLSIDVQRDIYSAGKADWLATPALRKLRFPINADGGVDTGGGEYSGRYFYLDNAEGWCILPYDADHELVLVGNLLGTSTTARIVCPRDARTILVRQKFSSLAQGVATSGSAITVADIWQHIIESGFTAEQMLRMMAAVAAGNATGLESGAPAFFSMDGAKQRIAATYANGSRTVTGRDAT